VTGIRDRGEQWIAERAAMNRFWKRTSVASAIVVDVDPEVRAVA